MSSFNGNLSPINVSFFDDIWSDVQANEQSIATNNNSNNPNLRSNMSRKDQPTTPTSNSPSPPQDTSNRSPSELASLQQKKRFFLIALGGASPRTQTQPSPTCFAHVPLHIHVHAHHTPHGGTRTRTLCCCLSRDFSVVTRHPNSSSSSSLVLFN